MLPIDKPPGSQMEKGGIHISGLVISGGRLNLKTYFLEDELAREFSSTVPAFLVKVKKRNPENIFIVIINHLF